MNHPNAALSARTIRVTDLNDHLRGAMWSLFEGYYDQVNRATFDTDLGQKDRVILLEDEAGRLRGFSTLQVLRRRVNGASCVVVYSGDTVVDRAYWGSRVLNRAFIAQLAKLKLAHPSTPLYWFLLSKGYKTYLLLARNFLEFWPRRDRPTAEGPRRLLSSLAFEKFGDDYDEQAGVVRFSKPRGRVGAGVAPLEGAVESDPDVRFFVEANPGHESGDELCCLGTVSLRFLVSAAFRNQKARR